MVQRVRAALVEVEAVGGGGGAGAAARVSARLEHRDPGALVGGGERRGHPGQAGTDHDDGAGRLAHDVLRSSVPHPDETAAVKV